MEGPTYVHLNTHIALLEAGSFEALPPTSRKAPPPGWARGTRHFGCLGTMKGGLLACLFGLLVTRFPFFCVISVMNTCRNPHWNVSWNVWTGHGFYVFKLLYWGKVCFKK